VPILTGFSLIITPECGNQLCLTKTLQMLGHIRLMKNNFSMKSFLCNLTFEVKKKMNLKFNNSTEISVTIRVFILSKLPYRLSEV
jgi:hypothetical protein